MIQIFLTDPDPGGQIITDPPDPEHMFCYIVALKWLFPPSAPRCAREVGQASRPGKGESGPPSPRREEDLQRGRGEDARQGENLQSCQGDGQSFSASPQGQRAVCWQAAQGKQGSFFVIRTREIHIINK
jgi:hypothetical protein